VPPANRRTQQGKAKPHPYADCYSQTASGKAKTTALCRRLTAGRNRAKQNHNTHLLYLHSIYPERFILF